MEREIELSNEVHVFYDKTKPGFKFYDKSPEEGSPEGKLVGVPPKGVYYTREIETAEWDEEINKPGETVSVRYIEGSNNVTTIMVSVEEYCEILERFEEEKKKEYVDGKIRIDLRPKIKMKDLVGDSIIKIKDENIKGLLDEFDKGFNKLTDEDKNKYGLDIKE